MNINILSDYRISISYLNNCERKFNIIVKKNKTWEIIFDNNTLYLKNNLFLYENNKFFYIFNNYFDININYK
jgi:hypothetical protein